MRRAIRDQSQFARQPCSMQSAISTMGRSRQAHGLSAFAGLFPLWSNEKACRYPMRLPDAWLAWLSYHSCKHFLGGIISSFCRAFRASGPGGTMCQGNEIRNQAYAIILCDLQTCYREYQRLLARSIRETLRESITS